jgi:hypothetical protein
MELEDNLAFSGLTSHSLKIYSMVRARTKRRKMWTTRLPLDILDAPQEVIRGGTLVGDTIHYKVVSLCIAVPNDDNFLQVRVV